MRFDRPNFDDPRQGAPSADRATEALCGVGNDMISRARRSDDVAPVNFARNAAQMSRPSVMVPCFTTDTQIATARGAVPMQELVIGDRVMTRDNGLQTVRWIGSKNISAAMLHAQRALRPVVIRAGAFGRALPAQDLTVSPNHRLLVSDPALVRDFGETEMLVAAKDLVGLPGVHRVDVASVTYFHFMLDRHEVVLSDGSWTESFQPADSSLGAIDAAQRQELFALFPSLRQAKSLRAFAAARRTLRGSQIAQIKPRG